MLLKEDNMKRNVKIEWILADTHSTCVEISFIIGSSRGNFSNALRDDPA